MWSPFDLLGNVFGEMIIGTGFVSEFLDKAGLSSQQRALKRCLRRSFIRFERRHHYLAATFFDWHFIQVIAKPLLEGAFTGELPTAQELMQAWKSQFSTTTDEALKSALAPTQEFLAFFAQELAKEKGFEFFREQRMKEAMLSEQQNTVIANRDMAQQTSQINERLSSIAGALSQGNLHEESAAKYLEIMQHDLADIRRLLYLLTSQPATQITIIEFTVDRDLKDYSKEDAAKLKAALKRLLGDDSNDTMAITGINKGSTKIRIAMSADAARRLLKLLNVTPSGIPELKILRVSGFDIIDESQKRTVYVKPNEPIKPIREIFENTEFFESVLDKTTYFRSLFINVRFNKASLREVSFSHCMMWQPNFDLADLTQANLGETAINQDIFTVTAFGSYISTNPLYYVQFVRALSPIQYIAGQMCILLDACWQIAQLQNLLVVNNFGPHNPIDPQTFSTALRLVLPEELEGHSDAETWLNDYNNAFQIRDIGYPDTSERIRLSRSLDDLRSFILQASLRLKEEGTNYLAIMQLPPMADIFSRMIVTMENMIETPLSSHYLDGLRQYIFSLLIDNMHPFSRAYALRGAKMPNGRLYNGQYNLEGDLRIAEQARISLYDHAAMAAFYGVSVAEYIAGQQPRPETEFGWR